MTYAANAIKEGEDKMPKNKESEKPIIYLGVAGARDYQLSGIVDKHIQATLNLLWKIYSNHRVVIITGDCDQGPDNRAKNYAKMHDIAYEPFPPDFKKHPGKQAYPIRNFDMVKKVSEVGGMFLTFITPKSRGTRQTIKACNKYNVLRIIFDENGNQVNNI